MYLKTPKRYTAKGRKRYLFSYKRLLLWLLLPVIIAGGWFVYRNRETYAPVVGGAVEQAFNSGSEVVATMMAPTPLPTENPVTVINRGDANWLAGRVEDAIIAYRDAVENVPNDVATHYNLAYGLIVEGRYDEAIEIAESAVTADPFSSDAWAVRALALARLGDNGRAIASGQHALQLNPNNPRAMAALTEAYINTEQWERARTTAEAAIEMDPNSAEAYYARAQVRQSIDFDREAARDDFATAFQLAPYLTDAAVDLAYNDYALYLNGELSNLDEALASLNAVRDANPDNGTVLLALGFMYYAGLGDPNQAADVLARCVNVNDQNEGCHYYYGRVLIGLEQYDDAAEFLDRAVQISTNSPSPNPRYHYWAGEAQIYLGNCPRALTYLRPGYEIAIEQENEQLASDLQGSIRECAAFDTSAPIPQPTQPAALEGDDSGIPTEETAVDATPNV